MTEPLVTDRDPLENAGFTEAELLEGLKRGLDDPGVLALLRLWTETMEAVADAHEDPDVGRVVLEIERATLYSKAGLDDLAEEAWNDAEDLAMATGRDRLTHEVERQRLTFQVLSTTLVVTQAQFHQAITKFLGGVK